MFPMKYRTKAVGATTDANWVGNIFIAFLPPIMFHEMGFKCFWIFTGINTIGFLLAWKLPETKDKTLEQINLMFEMWFHPKRKPGVGNTKNYDDEETEDYSGDDSSLDSE